MAYTRRPIKQCAYCGADYKQTLRRLHHCSWACYCNAQAESAEYPKTVFSGNCLRCGKTTGRRKKYCGNYCAVAASSLSKCRAPLKCKSTLNATATVVSAKVCEWCNEFYAARRAARQRFCSVRCSKANQKQVRRARKRNAFIEDVTIGYLRQRDNDICQICKKSVTNDVAPHPLSPSIDHVVPLSKGGMHSKANCQLAHFLCNSLKGDSLP